MQKCDVKYKPATSTTADLVVIESAGMSIAVAATDVVRLLLEKIAGTAVVAKLDAPPSIGSMWPGQGGIYAGAARAALGEPDHYLIVAEPERTSIDWDAAGTWASGIEVDGHHDFTLPKRNEQAVLYGNVPELFAKEAYWSGVEHTENAQYAWFQYFGYGTQYDFSKGASLRARAVRRLPIR